MDELIGGKRTKFLFPDMLEGGKTYNFSCGGTQQYTCKKGEQLTCIVLLGQVGNEVGEWIVPIFAIESDRKFKLSELPQVFSVKVSGKKLFFIF